METSVDYTKSKIKPQRISLRNNIVLYDRQLKVDGWKLKEGYYAVGLNTKDSYLKREKLVDPEWIVSEIDLSNEYTFFDLIKEIIALNNSESKKAKIREIQNLLYEEEKGLGSKLVVEIEHGPYKTIDRFSPREKVKPNIFEGRGFLILVGSE